MQNSTIGNKHDRILVPLSLSYALPLCSYLCHGTNTIPYAVDKVTLQKYRLSLVLSMLC